MDSKELRIGYWVNLRVGIQLKKEPHKITINDLVNIHNKVAFYDFTPIPLTEEWYPKFGYECLQELITDMIYKVKHPISENIGFWAVTISRLKVHQLQNLYFVLTEEELKDEV